MHACRKQLRNCLPAVSFHNHHQVQRPVLRAWQTALLALTAQWPNCLLESSPAGEDAWRVRRRGAWLRCCSVAGHGP